MAADDEETQPSLERTPTGLLGPEQVDIMPIAQDDHHHVPHILEHSQVLKYLRKVSVFQDFKKKELDKIVDALDIHHFHEGETVIKKGQPGRSFYMIKQGTVGFALDDGAIKGTRGVTEYFGEIALLEGGDCTATAIAQTDCEFFVLSKIDFDRLVKESLGEALDPLHNGLAGLLDAGGHPHMVSAEVQRMLKEYDTDGDGQFSVDEVETIISTLLQTKKRAKSMKYVAMAAFVALLAVCASMFAMAVLGAEVAKDVSQSDSGLMTVKGTDQVVQVASSDFTVDADGSLVMRVATPWDEHCEDGHCETDTGRRALQSTSETPIRTAAYLTEHALSSTVPDKYLAELKSFMYTSPLDGATMSVHVDSFVRIPEYGAHCKCTSSRRYS
jgi:CRP-like cAMP-binding protein